MGNRKDHIRVRRQRQRKTNCDITPPPLPIGASRAVWHRKGRGGGCSGGLKVQGDRQVASRAVPVPGHMADPGTQAATADPGTQTAPADPGTQAAMADPGTQAATADPGTQAATPPPLSMSYGYWKGGGGGGVTVCLPLPLSSHPYMVLPVPHH